MFAVLWRFKMAVKYKSSKFDLLIDSSAYKYINLSQRVGYISLRIMYGITT